MLLVACSHDSPVGSSGGGGGGGGTPLGPAKFNASVNPTPPPGYSITGETPYQWQTYLYDNGAWIPVGPLQITDTSAVLMVIDCNDPVLQDACTAHRSAMIQVSITEVAPGPARLCAYKSGFNFRNDFFLNTPMGTMSVAPSVASSQDPANQGVCFP